MKVVVLSNMAPFIWGGAEELGVHLVRNLRKARVEAEFIRIPFTWNPAERLIEEIALCRSLRLWNVDRVIALKFPAYHVPWDNKVLWLLHQYRQAYDLFDAGQSNIPNDERGRKIRQIIRDSDNVTFAEAKAIYANSTVTAKRLAHYNGVPSEVLRPPLNDPELFSEGDHEYGDYILASGRVNSGKRQWLLVDAMRHVTGRVRLVIAGPPDSEADAILLKARIAQAGVQGRVDLRLGFVPRSELARLVRNARAVAYLPFDEDSAGYVTMEAFQAKKAVITTSDSGGVLELVRDGESGYVAEPQPESIAIAINALSNGLTQAAELGNQAHSVWLSQNLNWPMTIERLLA